MQFAIESWNGRAIVFSEQLYKLESLALPTTFPGICSVESVTHLPTFAVFSWSRKRFTGGVVPATFGTVPGGIQGECITRAFVPSLVCDG